ncbi:hypothetical protein AB0K74_46010, partial [Streptomyces sp. NPDC056159]|uniref:hypothetical protein n=1 Tax=Streptomyces sp. NPDC056159 TaxID=3155537 RepID=UPI003433F806
AEKILAREAAGVLNWAIRGCLDWQKQGLAVPKSVTAKTREHIAQSNPLARLVVPRQRWPVLPAWGIDPMAGPVRRSPSSDGGSSRTW